MSLRGPLDPTGPKDPRGVKDARGARGASEVLAEDLLVIVSEHQELVVALSGYVPGDPRAGR